MADSNINVFEFNDPGQFLTAAYRTAGVGGRRRSLTLDAIASRLGYRSPRTIAMVLKGQRAPSRDLVDRLARDLELNPRERGYLESLIILQRRKEKGQPLTDLVRDLEGMREVRGSAMEISLAAFTYISNWYFLVIKQLLQRGVSANLDVLHQRLGRAISVPRIRSALDSMVKLGILIRAEDGTISVSQGNVTTTNDVPSAAIRSHHEQQMQRATEALHGQGVDEREFRSATFTFDRQRMAEAKEEIRRFQREFEARFSSQESTDVYQLNMQYFRQTNFAPEAALAKEIPGAPTSIAPNSH